MNKTQKGMTLIELMISLVLGAFLSLGVMQIYISNSSTSKLQIAHSRSMESARVALDLISRDARMAEFRGCADVSKINNMLDTSDSDYSRVSTILNPGLDGIDNVSNKTITGKTVVSGTDVLILRGSNDTCAGTGKAFPNNAAAFHVTQSCDVETGKVVMLVNCKTGDLFSITSVQQGVGGSSGKRTITHNKGNITKDGAVNNADDTFSGTYDESAKLLTPYEKQFFLSLGTNGSTSLYVNDTGTNIELVPNVVDFQVTYGEDTNDDQAVDKYDIASAVTMDNVINIRVMLKVSDGGHEETFDTAVNLRNRK